MAEELEKPECYLIEKYSVSLMPSINLTDLRYGNISQSPLLAMGSSTFPATDSNNLPSVPDTLKIITKLWNSQEPVQEEQFTPTELVRKRQDNPFAIVHLSTHGYFPETTEDIAKNAYVEFYNKRLYLEDFQKELKLGDKDSLIELLVLQACFTATGNYQAELGFAGSAHKMGVKSVLAGLWNVSSEASLPMMGEFYNQLKQAPFKAKALQKAQIALLGIDKEKQVTLKDDLLILSDKTEFTLSPNVAYNRNLTHPYYWASYTLVGSPW